MQLNITLKKKYKPLKVIIFNENMGGNWWTLKCHRNALNALGHDVQVWHAHGGGQRPALDWYALNPNIDIFFGLTYNLKPDLLECIRRWRLNNPDFKLVLYGSACGKYIDEIPLEYPLVRRSEEERRIVDKVRPSVITIHHPQKWVSKTLGGWRKDGHPIMGLQNGFDYVEYSNKRKDAFYESDLSFIGNRWPYKAVAIDKLFLPLCDPKLGLRVKIFSAGSWPVSQWLGPAEESETATIFENAKICPSVSEPHSQVYGFDCIERPYKVCGVGGGLCISDKVAALDDSYSGLLPSTNDPDEYRELVFHYLKHDDERITLVKRLQKITLERHTGFSRMNDLFKMLGMDDYRFNIKVEDGKETR